MFWRRLVENSDHKGLGWILCSSFQDRELARKLLKEGKKDRAKLLLRKKKYQEGLLDQTAGQLDNIERLCQDLEFSQVIIQLGCLLYCLSSVYFSHH